MTSSTDFKTRVKHKGVTGKFKSPGRIEFIIAALAAYEQAQAQRLSDIQQLSYLYEVLKQCKKWLAAKGDKTSTKSIDRKSHVMALAREVPGEMALNFPDLWQALSQFEQRKANPVGGQTTGPKGVYAHEKSLYDLNKSQGKYSSPIAPRHTGSATLYGSELYKLSNAGHVGNKGFKTSTLKHAANNGLFAQLTEQQFRELDKICHGQFNMLYLSKIQRLQYMLIVDNGLLKRHDGSLITLIPGATVKYELEHCAYAADKYGNIFVTTDADHSIQINHTTLCAGGEVLCAGTMSIKSGELRGVTNTSGHYKPNTAQLNQVLNLLVDAGVPMANVVVVDQAQGQFETMANPFMAGNYKPMPGARIAQVLNRTD